MVAEAIIIVNNGEPTTVVAAESREEAAAEETYSFSEMERYTDSEDLPAYGESLELEAEFSAEGSVVGVHEKENSGGDAQEKKYNGPDNSKLADENAPAVVKRKNSILSPKSSMLSKLKPFSPKVSTRSQSSSNRKPNHFFSEPSPKSKPSPKVKGMNVLSPRAPPTPKTKSSHPPVVPSPKVQGEKWSSPREALPKESPVAVEMQTDEEQVSLAVAPGRLGISLKIDKQRGGAKIVSIDSLSEFHGQVNVGDRIVGIDDRKVRNLNDFKVDSDKKRNFIICRNKKAPDQGSKEDVVTVPQDLDDPQTTRVEALKGDVPHELEEKKGLFATLLGAKEDVVTVPQDLDDPQTPLVEALKADVPNKIEENKGLSATFNFTSNRYNCATTVSSDSTSSSITTLLKPVTSCMECGHSHAIDKFGIAAESIEVDPEQMNSTVPSTAQISQLQISDHAFIKRSNGEWTYSEIIDKGRGSITFAVDNFGNGKTITKRRWKSSIRLVASAKNSFESESISEDDDSISSVDDYSYESVVEEYSTCSSSSGSEYSSEDESYTSSPGKSPSAADKKKQLKKMVDKKKMDLKAKKQEKKRQAKLAAAEAKRKERELKEAHELQVKLRLMHLEELQLEEEEEAEKERQRIKEEKTVKKLSEREEKKRMKVAKKVAEKEEMKRKKIDEQNDWKRVALLAKSEKEAKVQMKKLQKAKKQAAALEAKRQAELMFKGLEASVASPVAGEAADVSAVANEVDAFVNDFFLCEM